MKNWERVVALVWSASGKGLLTEETTWKAVVQTPKGKWDYLGIGLVEVMRKIVVAILNYRLAASIAYHNFLHGFWTGCGTGTFALDSKLVH